VIDIFSPLPLPEDCSATMHMSLLSEVLFTNNAEELSDIWNFPGCVGCIDGDGGTSMAQVLSFTGKWNSQITIRCNTSAN
jgi:hypothetical protein